MTLFSYDSRSKETETQSHDKSPYTNRNVKRGVKKLHCHKFLIIIVKYSRETLQSLKSVDFKVSLLRHVSLYQLNI